MSKWPSVDRKRKSAAIHHFDIQYSLFDIRHSLFESSPDRSNLLGSSTRGGGFRSKLSSKRLTVYSLWLIAYSLMLLADSFLQTFCKNLINLRNIQYFCRHPVRQGSLTIKQGKGLSLLKPVFYIALCNDSGTLSM